MSQKLTKDELEIKLGKAKKLIADLCEGKQKWTMRIPVDRNNDSDFILSDAIDALLSHVAALEEENEALKHPCNCCVLSGCGFYGECKCGKKQPEIKL